MKGPRTEVRLYPAIVLAFLIGLVGLGLLGVPAAVVAAIGVVVAALAIALFHRALEGGRGRAPTGTGEVRTDGAGERHDATAARGTSPPPPEPVSPPPFSLI